MGDRPATAVAVISMVMLFSGTAIGADPSDVAVGVMNRALVGSSYSVLEARQNWLDQPMSFDDQFSYQLEFRSTFGLPVEIDRITAVMVERPNNGSAEMYGLFLTEEEMAEMKRREELSVLGDQVREIARAWDGGAEYGGQWIDHLQGGVLVVATTGDVHVAEGKLRSVILRSQDLRVVKVDHSLTELEQVMATIASLHPRSDDGLNQIYIDEVANVVEVVVDDPATFDAGPVAAEAVRIVAGGRFEEIADPNSTYTSGRGGIDIGVYTTTGTGGKWCTYGFNVWRSGSAAMITAGHCSDGTTSALIADISVDVKQPQGGTLRANNAVAYRRLSSVADAMYIITSYASNNCYITTASSCTQITSTKANGSDQVGDTVCGGLAATGIYKCGTLEARGISGYSPKGVWMTNLRRWNLVNPSGDSGAGLKNGARAVGLLMFVDPNNSNHGIYAEIRRVETDLGVTVRTS